MIADKILDYLDTDGVAIDGAHLTHTLNAVSSSATRNFGAKDSETKRRTFGGSLAWYCLRRAWYSMIGGGAPVRGRSLLAFTFGDVTEALIVLLARQAGIVGLEWPNKHGQQLRLDDEIGGIAIGGSVDLGVRGDDGIVIGDAKSMSQYGFDKFKSAIVSPDSAAGRDCVAKQAHSNEKNRGDHQAFQAG